MCSGWMMLSAMCRWPAKPPVSVSTGQYCREITRWRLQHAFLGHPGDAVFQHGGQGYLIIKPQLRYGFSAIGMDPAGNQCDFFRGQAGFVTGEQAADGVELARQF